MRGALSPLPVARGEGDIPAASLRFRLKATCSIVEAHGWGEKCGQQTHPQKRAAGPATGLGRGPAQPAAEIVELFEIIESNADFARAALVADVDFRAERHAEFFFQRARIRVLEGRGFGGCGGADGRLRQPWKSSLNKKRMRGSRGAPTAFALYHLGGELQIGLAALALEVIEQHRFAVRRRL